MAAGYLDQFIEQGTTYLAQITLDAENGAAYNLTNYSVRSQARRSYYSANAAIEFEASILDAPAGVIQLYASASNTANLMVGKLVYDVLLYDNSNNATKVLEGQIFVTPLVTR